MKRLALVLCCLPAWYGVPADARPPVAESPLPLSEAPVRASDLPRGAGAAFFAAAATETTWLYAATFDVNGSCHTQAWTAVDYTAQQGTFFHVDDYAGLAFGPLRGTKSLWCGLRPGTGMILCQYATLPGYGNSWDQAWCTKTCIPVTGDLDVAMILRIDAEAGIDYATLEYSDCAGEDWVPIAGGSGSWTGTMQTTVANSYAIGGATQARVRIRFVSDGAWSDQDGLDPSDGAVHVDSLVVEGLALEDFEDEGVGGLASNDWTACVTPGYGITAGLVPGSTQLQEDPCARDLSCAWAFIAGSTYQYGCGSVPAQPAVPFGNPRGQYLDNEIWSPLIPVSGTGTDLVFEFSVYRDMPLDNLVFYNWAIRSVVNGCPTAWKRRTSTYYGAQKDWYRSVHSVGDLVNLSTATHVQVRLDAFDRCAVWCGVYGSGACHTHAPLFDNVRVYRVNTLGPRWNVQDQHLFQDSFAGDGTLTGTVRADMARDILPAQNPNIHPGDSTVAGVSDPVHGLAADPSDGAKKAVYAWVSVWPQGQPAKTGAGLSGGARWPAVGTQVIGGVTWTQVRFDQAYTAGGSPVSNTYCLDLDDALFTPGDTVCFFFSAKSNDGAGTTTYYSRDIGTVDDIAVAAANPMEFTCLPAGGYHRGGDILYVDGMDGRGAQPYWDTAFQSLGIRDEVDRYDVRAPSSSVGNRLDGRVADVNVQITGVYQRILWDCGDLDVTLGDGSRNPAKTDDYGLLNAFLGNLTAPGGVYLCGDDVATQLEGYASASAIAFQSTYLPFTLVAGDHRPSFGTAPAGVRNPYGPFDDDIVILGGCPLLNDFDVLEPIGASSAAMYYGGAGSNRGAVVSKSTNNGTTTVAAMLSGFAFEYIADDEYDGVLDRAGHLHDVIAFLGGVTSPATGAGPALENALSQNHPNPFNPATTIAYSLRGRSTVRLLVYDVAGARVRTLVDGERAAGSYTVTWDGRDDTGTVVASGVYFYRIVAGAWQETRKMVLLK